MMMYSVTDVQGLNSISRQVLANAAHALAGMVKRAAMRAAPRTAPPRRKPAAGRPHHVRRHHALRAAGHARARSDDYDCLVFHATGTGGQSMEKLVDSGLLAGVIDVTTTEVCRPADRRRVPGDRGPLRRHHPHAHALCRLGRRARHGQFRRAGHRARALPRPHALSSQSAGHADAHDGGGERPRSAAGSASGSI